MARVDALLPGVSVPAGEHEIELAYEPPRWRAGLGGAALSLVLLFAWLVLERRTRWNR